MATGWTQTSIFLRYFDYIYKIYIYCFIAMLHDIIKFFSFLFKCKLTFEIFSYSENHSARVKKFMLDMLSPLISEADVVSQELLDVILSQIIEPAKVSLIFSFSFLS